MDYSTTVLSAVRCSTHVWPIYSILVRDNASLLFSSSLSIRHLALCASLPLSPGCHCCLAGHTTLTIPHSTPPKLASQHSSPQHKPNPLSSLQCTHRTPSRPKSYPKSLFQTPPMPSSKPPSYTINPLSPSSPLLLHTSHAPYPLPSFPLGDCSFGGLRYSCSRPFCAEFVSPACAHTWTVASATPSCTVLYLLSGPPVLEQ